jgi:hypothetical protein
MSIDTKDTNRGLGQAKALREQIPGYVIPHAPQPDGGIGLCLNDSHDTWIGSLDEGAYAEPASQWLLNYPTVVTLADAIASERDEALAEVERLRGERDAIAGDLRLVTHKAITCGVIAEGKEHLNAIYQRGSEWDSPQAEKVRSVVAEVERLRKVLAAERGEADGAPNDAWQPHHNDAGFQCWALWRYRKTIVWVDIDGKGWHVHSNLVGLGELVDHCYRTALEAMEAADAALATTNEGGPHG